MTRDERLAGIFLLCLMVVGMCLEALGVGLVLPVLATLAQDDFVTNSRVISTFSAMIGNPSQPAMAVLGMSLLATVYVSKAVFLTYLSWQQTKFIYGIQAEFSRRLFATYLYQPYAFHIKRNSSELIQNVIGEINIFTFSVVAAELNLIAEALVLGGLVALLFVVEPLGSLVLIGLLGLGAISFYRLTRLKVERLGRARQHHDSKRILHVQQGLGGIKEIKLLAREESFLCQYDINNQLSSAAGCYQAGLLQMPRLWMETFAVLGLTVLVITVVAQGFGVGDLLATLGIFLAAAFRLLPSANRILAALQGLRYGGGVVEGLSLEMQTLTSDAIKSLKMAAKLSFEQSLALNGVSYSYALDRAPALKDISMTVLKGEMIGIIGTSGAGKSTLVDILLGILQPTVGEVTVDGKNIHDGLAWWQSQVGYVPQFIYLVDDTIRRNIALGSADEEIDDALVWRALCAANLVEFTQSLTEGLNTNVGERGIALSGGQRQRLGIARALYNDPQVLVFDEATSSLDVETEWSVMESVQNLQKNKTVIIVTHRNSTVKMCDRIYRIESGQIVAEGAPADVLHL